MDLTTPFISATQLALVPLVIGLVAIIKSTGLAGAKYDQPDAVNYRLAPLWSLALGLGGAFLLPSSSWQFTVLAGLVIGSTAAGVYAGGRTTLNV